MVHGNTFAQETLRTIFQSLQQNDANRPIFLLLTGPENVGKTTIAQELAKETLGGFFASDFLGLQDMTTLLGKKHAIKVGGDKESDILELVDGTEYKDTTVREATTRLQHSSASGKKILLLENIQRMTIGAANAFLKAAEEPLPGRIIIATTTHVSHVMATIVSRAIIVPFYALTDQEMDSFIQSQELQVPTDALLTLYKRMAMGRPGILKNLFALEEETHQLFLQALQALQSRQSIHTQHKVLVKIHKAGYLHIFLDAWIAQITSDDSIQAQHRIQIKKQLQTNVNPERLLLSGVLG